MATEYLSNKFLEDAILRFKKHKQEKTRYKLIVEDMSMSNEKRKINCLIPLFSDVDIYVQKYKNSEYHFEKSKNDLAQSFMVLSQHLVRYAKDIIIDQDDAVQEGVMICFDKIDRFNPEMGKAFNYMTTCILNHYRQIYRTDKNYRDLKERFKEFIIARTNGVIIRNGKETHTKDSIFD